MLREPRIERAELRVRLRVLNSAIYPDLPKVMEIVSCGFATEEQFSADPDAGRAINAVPEMDGVSRTEAGLACITDANGYVELVVKYAEQLGADAFLKRNFNVCHCRDRTCHGENPTTRILVHALADPTECIRCVWLALSVEHTLYSRVCAQCSHVDRYRCV